MKDQTLSTNGVLLSRRRFTLSLRLGFLLAAVAVGVWGVLHHPAFLEWRFSRLSLTSLQKERNGRMDDPVLLYHIGLRLNQLQRFAEADPLLRQAVGLDPESPRLRDEWARALLGSGLTTAAFGELKEFSGSHPNSAQGHLLLGKFYITQKSMQHASEELERAVALDPNLGEAWSYLAVAYDGREDLPRAREAVGKAASLRPDSAVDQLLLASLSARMSQPQEARQAFLRAGALAPKLPEVHREFARWLLDSGSGPEDARRAEAEARTAVGLDAHDALAQMALGRALLQNGQQEAGREALKQAADLAPNAPNAPFMLAQAYRNAGMQAEARHWDEIAHAREQYVGAERALLDRLRLNPKDLEAHRHLVTLYGKQGEVEGAVQHAAAVASSAIDSPITLILAANALTEGGHAREALPLAYRAVLVSNSNPVAHEALGTALLQSGDADAAVKEYNRAINLSPQLAPALRERLGRFAAEKAAHPSPAEAAYRQAHQLEAQNFGPRRITPEIQELARKAVTLEPDNPTYLGFLLDIHIALREKDAGIQVAKHLLQVAPNSPQGHTQLAFLLLDRATGPADLAEAEQHLQAAASDTIYAATRHYGLGIIALQRRQGALAAKELREAIRLDPSADVTYYKLAQAEQMAGNQKEADQARVEFRKRQDAKREEFTVLGDIAQHPNAPERYARAIAFYDSRGLKAQAQAIRNEANRRFGKETFGHAALSHAP